MTLGFDIAKIKTPCYLVDTQLVRANLEKLKFVMNETKCKILLAQKAFSMYSMYPLIAEYLDGTTASGLFEARLGYEKMGKPFGKETHVFSAAYGDLEFEGLLEICDYLVFNSFTQWKKFREKAMGKKKNKIKFGLRVNPECSTGDKAQYDPCAPFSRLGINEKNFRKYFAADMLDGISGIHFHTLCEQDSDDLVKTVEAVETSFGDYLGRMEWVNFGGGHHITREDYNVGLLIECINKFKKKYDVEVYLEPGEAVVLNAGYMVCRVLDKIYNGMEILILDASAACHAPDIIEAPYRAPVFSADLPNVKQYTYRLAGPTCLAGDIFGDYSFDAPLDIGDSLVFMDMAHYSMVKNNMFNGMPLPNIATTSNGEIKIVKRFGYEDFKGRL